MVRTLLFSSIGKRNFHSIKNLKQSVTELSTLSSSDVRKWLESFDTVISDCDGVLWHRQTIIEGSNLVINRLKNSGKKVFFATNNSTKTRQELADKSQRLGFNINKNEIVSTAYIAAQYLANLQFKKKVYVIGSDGIGEELNGVGITHFGIGPDPVISTYEELVKTELPRDPSVGAVLVGFDEHISLLKIMKAATYLTQQNCMFVATNTDESGTLPNGGVMPGTGCMVRAVEIVSGRNPLIMGKPNPNFCFNLIKKHDIVPERTLMIGDRANTDILFGSNCGFQTLMVGTGIHSLKDVHYWRLNGNEEDLKLVPDLYLPKLGDLAPFLT